MNASTIPLARPQTKLIFVGFGREAGATTSISLGNMASEGSRTDGNLRMVKFDAITVQPGQRFVLVATKQRTGINPRTQKEYNDAPFRLALEVPSEFDISALGEEVALDTEGAVPAETVA